MVGLVATPQIPGMSRRGQTVYPVDPLAYAIERLLSTAMAIATVVVWYVVSSRKAQSISQKNPEPAGVAKEMSRCVSPQE